MNTRLGEVSALGRRALKGTLPPTTLIDLGTVLTFKFDETRLIHMLVCHHLGKGGWKFADQFIRVGLDHLWIKRGRMRNYSIVQIGTGLVGRRDGANSAAIHAAIASSYLPVDLYVRGDKTFVAVEKISPPNVLKFVSGFSQNNGDLIAAAA